MLLNILILPTLICLSVAFPPPPTAFPSLSTIQANVSSPWIPQNPSSNQSSIQNITFGTLTVCLAFASVIVAWLHYARKESNSNSAHPSFSRSSTQVDGATSYELQDMVPPPPSTPGSLQEPPSSLLHITADIPEVVIEPAIS
ncbi:hypothetical protein K432DRAFT_400526 [Lepidopterella palustris CBS 459.81]|uniref:Uncharacterized protein n=1 Tax=Lepidopterella palustris CBS 459.81 TaxID=1314670 RepID=A0A8E2JJT3_9PEZI|nr:hypothetical protein K432DRAFT_400526 [Lepidopterella palustris CBS 459.81]